VCEFLLREFLKLIAIAGAIVMRPLVGRIIVEVDHSWSRAPRNRGRGVAFQFSIPTQAAV
jgi:hypothetical protein